MNLETIHRCFNGSTRSTAEAHRYTDLYCTMWSEKNPYGLPQYRVVDFTVTTDGHICLIMEEICPTE